MGREEVQNMAPPPENAKFENKLSKGSEVEKAEKVLDRPDSTGIFVQGLVHGIDIWLTVDTGASRTIVSKKIYDQLPRGSKPRLRKGVLKGNIEQAGGTPLENYGIAKLEIKIGRCSKLKDVVIADISDDVLLGMDFGKTIDVITSESCIKVDGVSIPCIHVKPRQLRRVFAATTTEVPGMAELLPTNFAECTGDEEEYEEALIEPSQGFLERHPVVMATTLVRTLEKKSRLARVMNPNSEVVVIHQGTTVGFLEPYDAKSGIIFEQEDESESRNMGNLRRIKLGLCSEDCVEYSLKGTHDKGLLGESSLKYSQVKSKNGLEVEDAKTSNSGWETYSAEIIKEDSDYTGDAKRVQALNSGYKRQEYTELRDSTLPDCLRALFEEATKGRTPGEKERILNLLHEYHDIYSKDETDLGCTHLTEHMIDTGNSPPIKQHPHRTPIALANEEKAEIEKLQTQGIIEESTSPWASPIVLVKKKNGKLRLCVDYRKVNAVTTKDAYPLPRTQDCLDAMSNATIFSTLDMTSGYNQIPVREGDIQKTAFITKHGLFQYKTMPFGLCNAPATFQRVMELALRGLQWVTCLIYLDDVIIFATTFEEHLLRLKQVFDRIRKANLKLQPGKCHLFQTEVEFLGHIVSKDGIKPNHCNISKIQQWKRPTNVTEVRQFLGLCSYYRRFVKNFSAIAKPLTDLTKKESKLE